MRRLAQMRIVLPAAVIVAGPVTAWFLVRDRGWETGWVLAAIGVAATLSIALAGLLERQLKEKPPPKAPLLPSENLENWRLFVLRKVVRLRLEDGGQLATMVRQGDPIDANVQRVDHDLGRPRVRVGGQLLAWSEITRPWEMSQGRLVILGAPGYGKTVAALTLVKHINTHAERGARIAELFPLAEWQCWRAEHPDARLADWLAAQLSTTYRDDEVPAGVARELIDRQLVIPVLDGLDEIATVEDRRACVAAIDAYAGRGAPHRPFVLTCRAREYRELAPDWIRGDDCVVLVGLQRDQIHQRLHEQTAGRRQWDRLRERQAAGDPTINALFASPLRLAIALQVYRDRDPSELLELPTHKAHARLWELLLHTHADSYRDATSTQVRSWLTWLAAAIQRTDRQRFMLHELHLLDDQRNKHVRAFRVAVGLATGLFVVLALALIAALQDDDPLGDAVREGAFFALFIAPGIGLVVGLTLDPRPSVRRRLPRWKGLLRDAAMPDAVRRGLIIGLGAALLGGLLVGGLVGGLVYGLIFGLMAFGWTLYEAKRTANDRAISKPRQKIAPISWRALGVAMLLVVLVAGLAEPVGLPEDTATALVASLVLAWPLYAVASLVARLSRAGTDMIETDPPTRFARAGPDAVLLASRSSGLAIGTPVALAVALALGLPLLTDAGLVGLIGGLVYGLIFGLVASMAGGLGAWLYHYWLRWRLRARGELPFRLPEFLDWCAKDERGWVRISDAYEFRHRELLEHLAASNNTG